MTELSNVLITGASGFIGAHLVKRLRQENVHLRLCTRRTLLNPEPDTEVVKRDLTHMTSMELQELCEGIDTIVHLAGYAHTYDRDESRYMAINYLVTRALAEAAERQGVRRFIFMSSVKAMSASQQRLDETANARPETLYGRSKKTAEDYLLAHTQSHRLNVTCLRPALIYGPGVKGNLAQLMTLFSKSWAPCLPSVANRRSMVSVWDLVEAVLLAARSERARGEVYIVTDDHTYATKEIEWAIRSALGKTRWGVPIPRFMFKWAAALSERHDQTTGRTLGWSRAQDAALFGNAYYSCEKIKQHLGYRPQWDFHAALPEMLRVSGVRKQV